MAMERVTVEQNGERFTLEVPEGTSDADIQSFLTQQQSTPPGAALTTAPSTPAENVGTYAGQVGAQVAKDYAEKTGGGLIGDAARIGKILYNNLTPAAVGSFIEHPVANTLKGASAYLHGLPVANMTLSEAVPAVGRSVAQGLVAPENLLTLPYNMAAYEQAKIRANPNAPGLQNNPYAQVVRGQEPTQAAAGAANAQKALIGQQYGGLNTQEQAILQADRQRQMAIQQRKQQARQVLAQPPSAQNFIERSKALAELYGDVGQ